MPGHDLICVGGSAGGVDAVLRLSEALPRGLPAAILLTIHVPRGSASNLPTLLSLRGRLPSRFACDGEPPERGVIHVARPDRHLLYADGVLRLSRGPHENGFRPSIDALLRSAAIAAGARAVGVVLSGTLDDGTAGLVAVRRAGGVAIVQDPADAPFPDMPRNALRGAGADHVVALRDLAPLLARVAAEPAGRPAGAPVAGLPGAGAGYTPFVCPDCGGVLSVEEEDLPAFRCQVGHRWNGKGLATKQAEALELALWAALRTLQEHLRLSRTLEQRALERGHSTTARRFAARARESEHRLKHVRRALGLSRPLRLRPAATAAGAEQEDVGTAVAPEDPSTGDAERRATDGDGDGAPRER
jgi:two-component system chemotaxis response regulator CheB